MSSDAPWQILSDCPHCLTEAAVSEWMDPRHPACHLGVPVERRCRLCGWREAADDEPFAPRQATRRGRCPACNDRLTPEARSGRAPCPHCGYAPTIRTRAEPADLTDPARANAALERWATAEGAADAEAFCQANMGASVDEVVQLLRARSAVPTTFDVIAFLFPGSGAGGAAPEPAVVVDREPVAPLPEAEPAEPVEMDPRTPARVLVSVMVADGALRAGERTFVVQWLEREGRPALAPDDLRLWRPSELGAPPPPPMAERLLEAAVHLMHLDRERDGSEWRVICAFGRAWGVPLATIEGWDRQYDRRYRSPMAALFRALDRVLRA